jgi:molecular chaperone GrpE
MEKNKIDEEISETQIYSQKDMDEVKSELNDKYLRLFAEFDNYKKRTHREKDEIKISTKIKMLEAILDVDSDISIALKSDSNNEGLNLITSKLNNWLKTQGIETISTDKYNTDVHEVISVVEIGEEKIVDVISKGYTLDGKPFRYPKVILGR